MIWNIVTDSSCDLQVFTLKENDLEINYTTVPFVITAGGRDFVDDDALVIDDLIDTMERDKKASHSSCPSSAVWEEQFRKEGNVIAITISKELSGSYNSASAAAMIVKEEDPQKNIAVINSVSAGSGLSILVRTICDKIRAGLPFAEVAEQAQKDANEKRTIFALCSFDNLIKNGRLSPVAGFVAKKLGFWGIGVATDEGKISIKGKVRGAKRALRSMLDDMQAWKTPIRQVVISHCQNQEMAESLKAEIEAHWNNVQIEIETTKGLCSYYAERHGLIVAYR